MEKKTSQRKYYVFVKQEKRLMKRKKNTLNYTMLSKVENFITMSKEEIMVMDFVVGQNSIQKRLTNFGKKVEKDYKNGEKKIQSNIMKNALNLS